MLTQGLVVDEPWIGHILAGRKTWEMRSRLTKKRGTIALIRKSSGLVVATATLTECLPSLSAATMSTHFSKHQIPQAKVVSPGYKWFTPWVLADVRPLKHPVRYAHPRGAVTFVNLDPKVITAVAKQQSSSISATAASANRSPIPENSERYITSKHQDVSQRVLDDLRFGSEKLDVPPTAKITISRNGNELYIDAVWDEENSHGAAASIGWRETLGTFAMLATAACTFLMISMLMIGIATWSATFFHAFYALPPLIVFMLVKEFA
tara:strand:+ start:12427 stop:13221 length:795 start_codon:yes stop_codon:yes gene_type:complete